MTSKRTIAGANETALLAQVKKIVYYARLDFSGGVERFHTEIGPKTAVHPIYGSESYTGIGDFGGLSAAVVESVSGAPKSVELSITGIKASKITTMLVDDYFRRDAEIMIGLEDDAGDLIEDPEIVFSGFMDKADIALNEGVGQITLTCESRGVNLLRSSDKRFTDEDKQAEVSGDLLAEYIWRMMDLELYWGGSPVGVRSGAPTNPNPNPETLPHF